MTDDDDELDPDVIHQGLTDAVSALIDLNSSITLASRKLAHDALRIRDGYVEAQELCEVIAKLHGESARIAAQATGDIISSEWGLSNGDGDDDEEGDDDLEDPA